jgi:N-acetylmuramoyl-L-alanine amidase
VSQSAPSIPAATPQVSEGPRNSLRLIVLDPGHGGTDNGARGPGGVLEKDAVLSIARTVRSELERQGYQVALTREGNDNPSFDDRAALANAQRGTVFITFHVSSTGPPGTARAYYFGGTRLDAPEPAASLQPTAPLRWEQAQLAFVATSRRLADLLQVQLGLKFRGSPEIAAPGVLRQLRSVAAPAVAVEISSVAVADAKALTNMAPGLAAAILRALEAYRPLYEAEGAR